MMYLAAGEAAGKAGGTTWDDLIQRRIFTPLGMTSSAPTYKGVTTSNVATAHAMNRDSIEKKGRFDAENIAGAGSIVSTANDMAQWLRFQLNDGMVDGKRLVSTAALRETHTPQMIIGGGPGAGEQTLFNTYGMGWIVQDYRHELAWQHGGNTPGMTAAMGMLPEKKLGVVVLTNMDHTPLADALMKYIFDRHLGAPVRDYAGEASARATAQRRPDTAAAHKPVPPPLPLTAYVGTFADSLYGEATISLENGTLELKRGLIRGPLEYWNANNFRWDSNGSIPATSQYIKFEVTPDDKVTGFYFGLPPDISLLSRKGKAGARR
jgi:CubicO group peptidase (beta-lactamase class C family)